MGPLSGKQHREYLKFAAKEKREDSKAELEESRKQELHEIKLQEAAQKANQGLGHKEDAHAAKMKEIGGPLGKGYTKGTIEVMPVGINVQGADLRTSNMYAKGSQAIPPVGSTDTVPAMLTPGEAVIPRKAAQNPKNKAAIKRMVFEGRQGFATGTIDVKDNIARIPVVGPKRVGRKGYELGSVGVSDDTPEFYSSTPIPPVDDNKNAWIPAPASVTDPEYTPADTLLQSQRMQESGGRHTNKDGSLVTSKAGAQGIAQIMPKTALDPGMGVIPVRNNSPEEAMRFQKDYMTALSKRYNGDEQKALAAYNGGMGTIDKAISMADAKGGNWLSYTPKETQDYVPSIMYRNKANTATVPKPSTFEMPQVDAMGNVTGVTDTVDQATGKVIPPQSTQLIPLPDTGAGQGRGNSQAVDPAEVSRVNILAAQTTQQLEPTIANEAAKINSSSAAPEVKKSMMESFLSDIYGDKGIFNSKDLARFAVLGAGGLLTGGTVNGSLRFAARNTLEMSDKRHAVEETERFKQVGLDQAEDKALRKSLLDQMYAPDKVEAYIKAKNAAKTSGGNISPEILGEPATTVKKTGAKPLVYTFSTGPLMGQQFPAEEMEHSTGRRKGDKEWYIKGVPVNDFAAAYSGSDPRIARATSGAQLVPFIDSEHGTRAKDDRYRQFDSDVSKDIKGIYDNEFGLPSDKSHKPRTGFPTEGEVSLAARKFFSARGDYNPDEESQKNAMRAITTQATRRMISTNASLDAKDRTNDITPYLAQEIIIGKSGVDSGAFMVGNRPMDAGLIAKMDDGLKDKAYKVNPKANPSEIEQGKATMLRKMYKDWKELKPTDKKYEGRKTTLAFYQYVEDQLKQK